MSLIAFVTVAGFISVIAILLTSKWSKYKREGGSITSYSLGIVWTLSSAVIALSSILWASWEAYSDNAQTISEVTFSLLVVSILMIIIEIISPVVTLVLKEYLRRSPETSFLKKFDVTRKDDTGELYKTLGKNGILFLTLELLLILWLFLGAVIVGSNV